jgi:C1A family cysteine protease
MKPTVIATLAGCVSALEATREEFGFYKQNFRKTYANEAVEEKHFKIFQKSVERINKGNAANGEPIFGLTWTSDLPKNKKNARGYVRNTGKTRSFDVMKVPNPQHPRAIDWRLTEAVTPIKNQGQCGSCWAFSATETIESHFMLGEGLQFGLELSPQQITSCTTADYGCGGGEPMDAYDYVMSVPGVTNQWNWPYVQSMTKMTETAPCDAAKEAAINGTLEPLEGRFAQLSGYKWATPPCYDAGCFTQDLQALAESVELGPVSICVAADMWDDYIGGVMSANACGPTGADFLDHCVQLVGFNNKAEKPYWIVRNSWGTEWGEKGNIYLQFDYNTCGLADEATIPIIANAQPEKYRPAFFQQATTPEHRPAFSQQVRTQVPAELGATRQHFESYKQRFGKIYANEVEEQERFDIFQEAVQRVNKANALNGEAVFGLTWSTDRKTDEKFQKGYKRNAKVRSADVIEVSDPQHPRTIDWRLTEVVTPIKNQGQCGSCWAFSATETIESHFILGEGMNYGLELSPQQVTSCTKADWGCGGGEPMDAYDYIMSVPGLTNQWNWPYVQSMTNGSEPTARCNKHKEKQINGTLEQLEGRFAQLDGYKWATPPCYDGCHTQDLTKLAESVELGPVSICVVAELWNDYLGGVLTANGCGPMDADFVDHCVQLVGFNNSVANPYWIVRNSWGTEWGENGNIYLEFDMNTCGLADEATIPIIANAEPEKHRPAFFQKATTPRAPIVV